MVNMLKRAEAELKIVIAGNHDITLDEKYYDKYGSRFHGHSGRQDVAQIRELYHGEDARSHGIVYMEEELRTFTLKNGARFTVYATPYQPEFYNWAFAYNRSQDRFNPSPEGAVSQAENPIPSFPHVDIVLTHGPPQGIGDEVGDQIPSGVHVGCEHLRRAVSRARPRIHCFGHIHEGHGAYLMDWDKEEFEKLPQDSVAELKNHCAHVDFSSDSSTPLKLGGETLFVNASVVTRSYEPLNAPWLVDIDLPRAPANE